MSLSTASSSTTREASSSTQSSTSNSSSSSSSSPSSNLIAGNTPSEIKARSHLKSRTVCCAIPVSKQSGKVLMITSRKHGEKWIFPKGGWEKGESLEEAAVREAWEEAGTPKAISPHCACREIYQGTAQSGDGQREIKYHIYEMEVDEAELCEEWPESNQRLRSFFSVPEALHRCQAWHNEKNTKLELVHGFRKTSIYGKWKREKEESEDGGGGVRVGVDVEEEIGVRIPKKKEEE